MRYAIMSDVHSNPVALALALKDAKERMCRRFLMLGDTTGYGYDVKESIKLVRKNFDVVLIGNHDSVCIGRESDQGLRKYQNYKTDMEQGESLTEEEKKWLAACPFTVEEEGALFSHGNFIEPESWGYVGTPREVEANFHRSPARLMFCGHTHQATAWEEKDGRIVQRMFFKTPATKLELKPFRPKRDCRYIINVGSVGYPRNDLCATYVIWDTETNCISFRRIPFDFKGYIKEMLNRKLDLPEWLFEIITVSLNKKA
ncbi:MAG: metallophosphatase family protein [Kiritimatiellae bacterium]|nr:metallophosphatase family protein [Kiritimatiellia bacterium]